MVDKVIVIKIIKFFIYCKKQFSRFQIKPKRLNSNQIPAIAIKKLIVCK